MKMLNSHVYRTIFIITIVLSITGFVFASAGPPANISIVSGNPQEGTVGTALPAPFVVRVTDGSGNPVPGTTVKWAVQSGGGHFPVASTLTNSSGVASNRLTLGTGYEFDLARATTETGAAVEMGGTANPGPAKTITAESGNGQSGIVGNPLAAGLEVICRDQYGNIAAHSQIDWSVASGGGSLGAPSTITIGGLTTNHLTLGPNAAANEVVARINGTATSYTFKETATLPSSTVVDLQYSSDPNPRALEPYFLGLSYQKEWMSVPLLRADNTNLVQLFKNLGPGVLRVVAERPNDPLIWDPNGPGEIYGTYSRADLARIEGFLEATNWRILWGIPLVNNKAFCSSGSSSCAASEMAAAAQIFGSRLYGLEFGNEPDQYTDAVYIDPLVPHDPLVAQLPGYTFDQFISTAPTYSRSGQPLPSWPAWANAAHSVAPGVPLTGPATGIDWDLPFAASNQAQYASLLTRHYYHSALYPLPTMADLMTSDPRVPVEFPEMRRAAAAAGMSGGYRVTETNSVCGNDPGVADAFGAALWTIDFLFTNAYYQSSGVNFHGGGFQAPGGFSPIWDNSIGVTALGPDYYGLYVYSMLDKGGTVLTPQVSPSISTFSAYGVKQVDDETDVILINRNTSHSMTVRVAGPSSVTSANTLLLTAPSLTATSGFTLGGSRIQINGSWSPVSNPEVPVENGSAVVTVPPASAQIVRMF